MANPEPTDTPPAQDDAQPLVLAPTERTGDAAVKKPNETIAIRPRKGGKLTVLTRRIYNALLYQAQKQGGKGPYQVPLSTLIADAQFNSKNTRVLKDYLVEMQTTAIEWYSGSAGRRRWDSTQLLGPVSIEEQGPGLPVLISWRFPEDLGEEVLRPKAYTKLLLEAGGQMRSYAAAVLFEVGMQYLSMPAALRLTMREDLLWWVEVLTGKSGVKEVDYRYFKRDVITRALKELHALQDEFTLKLREHKRGNRVYQLQFEVHPKQQRGLGVTEPKNIFDLALVERMRKLGISQDDSESLYVSTDESVLRAGVDHLEQRMANTALPPIGSPYRYLQHAIKQGYIEAGPAARQPEEQGRAPDHAPAPRVGVRASMQTIRDEWLRDRATRAQRSFDSRSPAECRELQQQFEATELPGQLEAIAKAWGKDGARSKVAGPVFFRWLAAKWMAAEPTDAELVAFAIERGMLAVEPTASA